MARTAAFAALALAACLFPLAAQVVVEDDIVTTDVWIAGADAANRYNITAAVGMSIVLPGAGHYYVNKPSSAFAYLSVDIASIFGAIVFNSYANRREAEARSYAVAAAGIARAPSGEAYWRHVGAFMDAAEFNETVTLSRGEADELYADPDSWWRWGGDEQREQYNSIRRKARTMRVASSFFVGALVANRLVSAVDLRVFQRKSLARGINFQSAVTPDMKGAALSLTAEF